MKRPTRETINMGTYLRMYCRYEELPWHQIRIILKQEFGSNHNWSAVATRLINAHYLEYTGKSVNSKIPESRGRLVPIYKVL